MRYEPSDEMMERFEREFVYHSPKEDQPERYVEIRNLAHNFAIRIANNTPPSREQSLALTKLGEVVMWANAAIARNE